MWKYLGVVAVAMLLAMVSPLLAAADDGLILRSWFQWLPIKVDLHFLPATEMTLLALVMAGLAAQYLLIFLLLTPLRPLLRRFAKVVFRPLRRRPLAN
jgi:hypothetical protein